MIYNENIYIIETDTDEYNTAKRVTSWMQVTNVNLGTV